MQVSARHALAAPLLLALALPPKPVAADAAPTPAQLYKQARALAKQRKKAPCDAMFEEVRDTLERALKRSRRLRRKAFKDPAFNELRGTCMYQRLARGLDLGKPAHRRRMLHAVNWHGTNWGTNAPGPTDTITFKGRRATLQAMKLRNGWPIKGTFSLQGGALLIRGKAKAPNGKVYPVQIKLMFNPEACALTLNGEVVFSDTPDECNT